jgi:serine/threonine protein kinase/Tol biopolymer transport system component
MATKCPKCHFENPDDTFYCGKCATRLSPDRAKSPEDLKRPTPDVSRDVASGTTMAAKYRILAKLGAGGMGEVYRAEDLSLNRQVAIKVLPDMFAGDPERLARFQREARVLASLNHPNIAAIHGVEEADGKRFLVLELVEGETLAERLVRGPLSLEETLDVCRQIAEGLEGAHEKNIIHRDLKPSNVKITPEGKVKILDFGLARAFHDQISEVDIINSPTITADMTRPGVILGTAAYMSPEQARGKAVDKRADIWAFGCILYECLTGLRAFSGETITETLAAILKGEPDWQVLPGTVPAKVNDLLRRCLQKDPKERLHDIADARLEIEAPTAYPPEATPVRRPFPLPWLVAGAVVMLLAGILIDRLLIRHPKTTLSAPTVTATIKVELGYWLDGMRRSLDIDRPSRTAMAISSDGEFVVYSAIKENPGPQDKPCLYLRKMDQLEAKAIAGTEGGISPFLSPDSKWVGYWADGKLKKIPVGGGVATELCDVPLLFGANWSRDNSVVFADGDTTGLSRISAEGGKPEILTKPDPKREEMSHRLPSWLPDGKAVLFTVMRYAWDSRPWLALLRQDTREWKVLLEDAADARYVPTGHIVFLRQGRLMAVRFDLTKLEVIGQPIALVDNVIQSFVTDSGFNTGAGQFSISDTGSLIYAAGGVAPDAKGSLVWVDQRGIEEPVTALQFPFLGPRLSPDGQKITYLTAAREWQVYVYDLGRGTNSQLSGEGLAGFPIWSPDGKRILFSWAKSLASNLYSQTYDGSSPMERLTTSEYYQEAGSWSPDGKTVALVEGHPDTNYDIAVLDIASGRVTPFLNSKFSEESPDLSSDGRWIAYSSDESKRDEVYVRPFPGPGMKQQVSSEGGIQPLWAKDGKQLFFRWQDQVWVVDVRTDGGFAASKPRLLFERPGHAMGAPIRGYDLSLDGKRFLMVKFEQTKPTPVTEMMLVQNWFKELKRLVPTGKK